MVVERSILTSNTTRLIKKYLDEVDNSPGNKVLISLTKGWNGRLQILVHLQNLQTNEFNCKEKYQDIRGYQEKTKKKKREKIKRQKTLKNLNESLTYHER